MYRLQGYTSDEEDDEALSGPDKVTALRQVVVKLSADNAQLQEDNRCLRRDLEQALDEEEGASDAEDKDEGKISKQSCIILQHYDVTWGHGHAYQNTLDLLAFDLCHIYI